MIVQRYSGAAAVSATPTEKKSNNIKLIFYEDGGVKQIVL